MKVFVDMQKLKAPNSGLGVFCKELGRALVRQNSGFDFTFLVPNKMPLDFGKVLKYIYLKPWHSLFIPNTNSFDIWHCTHQDSRFFPSGNKAKILLTIHDLNFLYKYNGIKRRIKHFQLQRKISKAHTLAYISAFTQQQVRANFQIGNTPEHIVYNGIPTPAKPVKPEIVDGSDAFFFTIGIINPKKNTHVLPQLLTAFPNHKLLIAGKCDEAYSIRILAEAKAHDVTERVLFCGEISDAEKSWLFTNCSAFFFPSLAEGFGLPVVEAMQYGVPVFLSYQTALPEIGGNVCYYWHSFHAAEMIQVVREGLNDFATHREKSNALKARASIYSWEKAAEQYLAIYKQMMSSP